MTVIYQDKPGARTTLAKALRDLDLNDNFTINNAVYEVASPMLECSTTGALSK